MTAITLKFERNIFEQPSLSKNTATVKNIASILSKLNQLNELPYPFTLVVTHGGTKSYKVTIEGYPVSILISKESACNAGFYLPKKEKDFVFYDAVESFPKVEPFDPTSEKIESTQPTSNADKIGKYFQSIIPVLVTVDEERITVGDFLYKTIFLRPINCSMEEKNDRTNFHLTFETKRTIKFEKNIPSEFSMIQNGILTIAKEVKGHVDLTNSQLIFEGDSIKGSTVMDVYLTAVKKDLKHPEADRIKLTGTRFLMSKNVGIDAQTFVDMIKSNI